jgi:hypothetical protein
LEWQAFSLSFRHQIKEAGKTKFKPVVKLTSTPISKPVKDVKVVKNLDKRTRDNREKVLDLIFAAFQSHEFYTFTDLVNKTQQPPVSFQLCSKWGPHQAVLRVIGCPL